MTDNPSAPPPAPPSSDPLSPLPHRPRSSPLACWCVIVASVVMILVMNHLSRIAGQSATQAYGPREEALALPMIELQARLIYPLLTQSEAAIAQGGMAASTVRDSLQENINPYAVTPRLAAHIAAYNAAAMISDPNPFDTVAISLAALDESQIQEIKRLAADHAGLAEVPDIPEEGDPTLDPGFAAVTRALLILAANPAEAEDERNLALQELVRSNILRRGPAPVDEAERLRRELGWFGAVLVARGEPQGSPPAAAASRPAWIATTSFAALLIAALVAATVGLVLLIVGSVLRAQGTLHFLLPPAAGPAELYLEAFAVYLGGSAFVVEGGAAVLASLGVPVGPMPLIGLVVVSLLAVIWPLLRCPSRRGAVARDLGLHRGRGFAVEAAMGFVGYLAGLPIVAAGFLLTLGLTIVLAPAGAEDGPPPVLAHPVILWIAEGGTLERILVLLLGAVFAPFVEEALFRGSLFGYVRTRLAFVPSALLVAFIFAVIHPQGLAAVPVLMSLAISFAIIREWRGSLVGPMVAHALNNGAVLTVLWLALM